MIVMFDVLVLLRLWVPPTKVVERTRDNLTKPFACRVERVANEARPECENRPALLDSKRELTTVASQIFVSCVENSFAHVAH